MSVLHGSLDATHLVLLYIGAALAGAGGGFAEAAIFAEGSPAATHLQGRQRRSGLVVLTVVGFEVVCAGHTRHSPAANFVF